jgi:hypothetical protein
MLKATGRETGCLFCGNEHARFKSEEHIIAVALGNSVASGLVERELVIGPGEVCDKCNFKRLRDRALAEWPPVSVFRSLAQISNRRGRLVDAVVDTRWRAEPDPDDPSGFRLRAVASTGPGSGRDDVARAICKVAVEARWLQDPDDARSERWDAVAEAAIGGPLPPGIVMGLSLPSSFADIDLTPDCDVLVDARSTQLSMVCELWVVGLRLLLFLDSPVPAVPRTAWWTVDPETGSLCGPGSMWASFDCRARTATRLTDVGEPRSACSTQLPTGDAATRMYLLSSPPKPQ